MFAFNGLAFLALTGIQQFIAVFFPLKLRMWVTTGKTRLTMAVIYVINFLLQCSIYVVNICLKDTYVIYGSYVNAINVLFLVTVMILVYFAMFVNSLCELVSRRTHKLSKTLKHTENFMTRKQFVCFLLSPWDLNLQWWPIF